MNDLVSIVVPVYNSEKYLRDTVSSFINQTYKDIEIILVEGFSSDNSLELCRELQRGENRIEIIVHDQNYGPERARNDGIRAAKGKWFMFVDSDDLIPPDAIEALVQSAREYDSDIVFAGFDEVWLDGKKETIYPDADEGKYDKNSFVGLFLDKLSIPVLSCVGSKLYRTEMVRDNGLKVDKECRHNADLAFTMDAARCCKSASVIKKSVYEYIKRESSMMNSYRAGIFESISNARSKLVNLIKEEGYFEEKKALYYKMKIGLMMESLINEYQYGNDIRKAIDLYLKDHDTAEAIDYTLRYDDSLKTKAFVFLIKHKNISSIKTIMKLRYSTQM